MINSKRFLVIGSNSFSGSHFISKLIKEEIPVKCISRSQEANHIFLPYRWETQTNKQNLEKLEMFSFHQADLNKDIQSILEIIDNFKPSHIINFAAQGMVAESWLDPTNWYQTNVVSQVRLHDALRKRKFIDKYVHITTPEVYGSTDSGWIKESDIFLPSTPYAVSRAACDLHLISFFKAYNFPVIFTRSANVYGAGQQLYRIIPRTILSANTNKKMTIHGGGLSERSFIHISDVVEATLTLALKATPGTTWHLSTRQAISIRSLVEKICEINQVDFTDLVEVGEERLGKDQSYLLDSSEIRNQYGWEELVSLEDGIEETGQWIKKNLSELSRMPWHYEHKA